MARDATLPLLLAGFGVVTAVAVVAMAATSPSGQLAIDDGKRAVRRGGVLVTDWIDTLIRKTSAHEGTYWSVQRNLDGNGVSYGILQWTQRGGALVDVLAAMRAADLALFDRTFGGTANAAAMLDHVRGRDLGKLRGANLWDSPWLERFVAAGKMPVFQAAQRSVAANGDHMRGAVKVARVLGVSSERALTLCYNRTVHQGVAGALGPAERLVAWYAADPARRPLHERHLLAQYAWYCASKFRRKDAPASERFSDAARWVQLRAGSTERELELVKGGGVRLIRVAQTGPTWHVVTGTWDLWDLILTRSADILNDAELRDGTVSFDIVA